MTHDPAHTPPLLRDLPGLADFATVARLEHVSRAAEVLGIPQPTLSRRLARLEAALGVPLLTRRGRRVEVTRAGRTLASAVERALGELDRGLDEIVRDHHGRLGNVSLAFLHTLGPEVVPRLLREFRALYPGISFSLVQDGHQAVLERLRSGEADLALTAPLPDEPELSASPLQTQRLCLAVPAAHPLARAPRIGLRAAEAEVFIGFKHGYGMRRISDDWCRAAGFAPRLAFEGEDVGTVRGLVAAGLGVALLPATGSPPPGVVEVAVDFPTATRTIGMAWLTDRPLSAAARAFREFMLEAGRGLMHDGPSPARPVAGRGTDEPTRVRAPGVPDLDGEGTDAEGDR